MTERIKINIDFYRRIKNEIAVLKTIAKQNKTKNNDHKQIK